MEDRTRALIFLYEYHLKGRGGEHTRETKRALQAIREIAYPATEEKAAQPEKYKSHQAVTPVSRDTGENQINPKAEPKIKKLSDIDPKQYY